MKKRFLFKLSIPALLLMTLLITAFAVVSTQTHAASSWPIYKNGSSGEDVVSIQYMLRARGYSLAADGKFGPGTEKQVKSFQSKSGLTADGIVGSLTWEKLIVTTKQGSTGDAVIALQRQLNASGAQLTADGKFGALTDNAVKNFQSSKKLSVDGVAGPQTWNGLVGGNGGGGASGTYTVVHAPTITATFINKVLSANNSPAKGTGQALYDDGVKYGIDPVYGLAFFRHESSFGKNGIATRNKSLGNIRCSTASTGYTCSGGFRKYATWAAGYDDWYRLIRKSYVDARHLKTVDQIIPVYAPSNENDVAAYIRAVKQAVDAWRAGHVAV